MYTTACEVSSRVISASGDLVTQFEDKLSGCFCSVVGNQKCANENCKHSSLYGGLQAEKLGQEYIFLCPYGLTNWAVPIMDEKRAVYYVVGGPVLIHEVDEIMVDKIIQRNQNESRKRLLTVLNEIPVMDCQRVRYLARVLFGLVQGIVGSNMDVLLERQQYNQLGAAIGQTIHELKQGCGNSDSYPYKLETDLVTKVKIGDKRGAREVLNEILGVIYFEDSVFEIKKSRLIELAVVLARASIEAGADLEVIFGIEYSYLSNLEDSTDLMEMSNLLVKVLERFIECAFALSSVKNRNLIFRAIAYIRNHMEKEISLEDVAAEVGLSAAYFSKLFKEEMSITYTDYLNKVRIEAAKMLLRQDNSLAEISQAVGYNDQSYFSKVFKKYTGLTPRRWRLQSRGNQKEKLG